MLVTGGNGPQNFFSLRHHLRTNSISRQQHQMRVQFPGLSVQLYDFECDDKFG